ncbi:MAG: hypothetical protein V1895_03065, partial [Parcubacteria group bacterium]
VTGNQVTLAGNVGDAHVRAPLTTVASGAEVQDLRQVGRTGPIISEGAIVNRQNHRVLPFTAFGRYQGWQAYLAWFFSNLLWILGASLLLWRYQRTHLQHFADNLRHSVFNCALTGLTLVLIGGSLAIGVLSTRVGIHLALILLLLLVLAGHVGFILFSWVVGGLLGKLIWREQATSLAAIVVGATVTAGLLVIPLVGNALVLLIGLLGIGCLTRSLVRAKLRSEHDRSQPAARKS